MKTLLYLFREVGVPKLIYCPRCKAVKLCIPSFSIAHEDPCSALDFLDRAGKYEVEKLGNGDAEEDKKGENKKALLYLIRGGIAGQAFLRAPFVLDLLFHRWSQYVTYCDIIVPDKEIYFNHILPCPKPFRRDPRHGTYWAVTSMSPHIYSSYLQNIFVTRNSVCMRLLTSI